MKKEEILKLEGRELDAIIAEKVMGAEIRVGLMRLAESSPPIAIRPYSSDLTAAFSVIDKITVERATCCDIFINGDGYQVVSFDGNDYFEVDGCEPLPKLICLAALLASQGEVSAPRCYGDVPTLVGTIPCALDKDHSGECLPVKDKETK